MWCESSNSQLLTSPSPNTYNEKEKRDLKDIKPCLGQQVVTFLEQGQFSKYNHFLQQGNSCKHHQGRTVCSVLPDGGYKPCRNNFRFPPWLVHLEYFHSVNLEVRSLHNGYKLGRNPAAKKVTLKQTNCLFPNMF